MHRGADRGQGGRASGVRLQDERFFAASTQVASNADVVHTYERC
jgi:hypothetical protein